MQESVLLGGILGVSLILAVSIYVFARLRIEQERTLQKLIDRGLSAEELARSSGLAGRAGRDLRRGLLLAGLGIAWSAVTCFLGGVAWILGIFPLILGAVYVLLWAFDDRPR